MNVRSMILICQILLLGLVACGEGAVDGTEEEAPHLGTSSAALRGPRTTGEVEIVFKGGNGSGPEKERRAFAAFDAHESFVTRPAKGVFYYRVYNADLTQLHREIEVQVGWVSVVGDHTQFFGVVTKDTKPCADADAGPGGGGCSSDHTDEGGHDESCSGHDSTGSTGTDHDGGSCGGGDEGSCGGEDDHDGGSCGGEDDHDGGSCGGEDHDGGSCGGGGDHGGPAVSGKYCRTGQFLFAKVKDGSTPAVPDDRIHWKWFDPAAPERMPNLDTFPWQHLCKKEIIDGNIVVHAPQQQELEM